MTYPLIHPGEILRQEYLVPLGLSALALARICKVPRTRIERVVAEKTAIEADTALRLAKALGTTPQFWMNMQASYNLAKAMQTTTLDDVGTIAA